MYPVRLMTVLILCYPLLEPAHSHALVNETLKLTAFGPSEGDYFGSSVAVSGNTVVVGAPETDFLSFRRSGAVNVYDTTTGNRLFRLNFYNGEVDQYFGSSVAISGNTVIVGAYGDNENGYRSGSAYIYDIVTRNRLLKLTASDATADDMFGSSVAISGNIAIVGADGNDDVGTNSGSAYVFDTTSGEELFKLTASDDYHLDNFGTSVAISGTTAIIGAVGDDDAGSSSGSAYVFDVTTGKELFKLTASDATEGDQFGWSVAISGNIAIIGARFDDDAGYRSGSAYVYDITTGNELFKLIAPDAAQRDEFGFSVAISGDIAIVGARYNDDAGFRSGSSYVFDTTTGEELFKLYASDNTQGDEYGFSVAMSGTTAVIGARYDDDGGFNSGSAYIFNNVPEPGVAELIAVGLPCILRRRGLMR